MSDRPRTHVFRIFVNGRRPERSLRAMQTLLLVCREHLPDRHRIIPVDVHVSPELVRRYEILVIPTIIRESPEPPVRLVGDLSDHYVVLRALGLTATQATGPSADHAHASVISGAAMDTITGP
jgi:circadian clock protein KaiB